MESRINQFLRVVEIYCASTKRSEARVSTLTLNGGGRIASLRKGRDVGTRVLELAFQWLSDNWPEGAEWPSDIPRPDALPVLPSSGTANRKVEAV